MWECWISKLQPLLPPKRFQICTFGGDEPPARPPLQLFAGNLVVVSDVNALLGVASNDQEVVVVGARFDRHQIKGLVESHAPVLGTRASNRFHVFVIRRCSRREL